ncbi:MAG: GNAT family N-acetyltransferase [Actinomycetota bacterium]|nr:GNAT family N-acetyltransferase [Actinomycetota bacterium]
MSEVSLLHRLETYLDAVPRSAANAEPFGPLTLFNRAGAGWPYYARPTLGWTGDMAAADLAAVRRRQRELDLPEAFEWVDNTTPSLLPLAVRAGLHVEALPLMVLTRPILASPPPGIRVRTLAADDPWLARATAVAEVAFATPGTLTGTAGESDRDTAAALLYPQRMRASRDRIRRGLTVTAVAASDGAGPVCVGSHQPVGDVTEIVGVGTLPSARRGGIAAAVTAHLVADAAARGVSTIFLSAGSEDVARLYARVGFERIGTSCIAEPAAG